MANIGLTIKGSRRIVGNASDFTAVNPVLENGDIGFEFDTQKQKIGDGVSTYSALSYVGGATGATSANPTGTIGLTATNGSALTFMRSDAAPALNLAIVPTWTGAHTFSVSPVVPTVAGSTDSTTKAASTAFVQAVVTAKTPNASTSTKGLVNQAATVADATGWTDTTAMAKFNALLAALRTAGLLA